MDGPSDSGADGEYASNEEEDGDFCEKGRRAVDERAYIEPLRQSARGFY